MDWPKISPVPPVGVIKPNSIRIVVVLPEPFGPTKPQIVPKGTSNVAWDTAMRSPYFLLKSVTDIAVLDMGLTLSQLPREYTMGLPPAQ